MLGHELTHVRNRDVMVMTIASFFASIAAFITQMGFWFGGAFGTSATTRTAGIAFIFVILVSAVVYAGLLAPAPGALALPGVRRRPRLGDPHRAAERADLGPDEDQRPDGPIPQRDLRAASGELAAFYIVPPRAKQSVANLFSTHPPLEARIAALQRLEAQLQGTAELRRLGRLRSLGLLDVILGRRKLAARRPIGCLRSAPPT